MDEQRSIGAEGLEALGDDEAAALFAWFEGGGDGGIAGRSACAEGRAVTDPVPATDAGSRTSPAEAVFRVLALAAAPAQPHELDGYDEARRAFASAVRERKGGRRHRLALALGRMATVKIVAFFGAFAVGSAAVAAEANVLPSAAQRIAHTVLGGMGVPDAETREPSTTLRSSGVAPEPSGLPHSTVSAKGGGATTSLETTSRQAASPSSAFPADAIALCSALAQDAGGGKLPHDGRRRLADLAGGEKNIEGYCTRVLSTTGTTQVPPSIPQPSGQVPPDTSVPGPPSDSKPGKGHKRSPSSDPDHGGNGHHHAAPDPSAQKR